MNMDGEKVVSNSCREILELLLRNIRDKQEKGQIKELTEWSEPDSRTVTTNIGNFSASQIKEPEIQISDLKLGFVTRLLWSNEGIKKETKQRLVQLHDQRKKKEKEVNREELERVAAASYL